jgi:hypothetical protein
MGEKTQNSGCPMPLFQLWNLDFRVVSAAYFTLNQQKTDRRDIVKREVGLLRLSALLLVGRKRVVHSLSREVLFLAENNCFGDW